jgi:hypothetical protein
MRRVLTILIFINAAGVFAFAAMWFYAAWFVPLRSGLRVTELDRAQVIDAVKLNAFSPALASNVRYNLAAWIAEPEREACVFNAICGLVVCAVNLGAILVGSICVDHTHPGDPEQQPGAAPPVG